MTVDTAEAWLIRADVPECVLAYLRPLLDESERSRATGWRRAEHRRYVVAHGVTRLILGDRLDVPPSQIRFTLGQHGKPQLAGAWTGMQMSLSHSGEYCVLALSAHRRVGVDIQHVAMRFEPGAMAMRYFPPPEARFVLAAAPIQRAQRFARLWARKEALTKAHGGRLVPGLRVPVNVTRHSIVAGDPAHRLTDIVAPRGFRAAIALAGRASYRVSVRRWCWSLDPSGQLKQIEARER